MPLQTVNLQAPVAAGVVENSELPENASLEATESISEAESDNAEFVADTANVEAVDNLSDFASEGTWDSYGTYYNTGYYDS